MSLRERAAALREHLKETGENLPDLSARLALNGVQRAEDVHQHISAEIIDGCAALQEAANDARNKFAVATGDVNDKLLVVDGWLGQLSITDIGKLMSEAGVDDITEDGALEAIEEMVADDSDGAATAA